MPPWAATGLGGAEGEGQVMPLQDFIGQAIEELATDSEEIVVKQARTYRNNAGPGEHAYVNESHLPGRPAA